MSVTKWTDAHIFVGSRDLTGKHNSISVAYNVAMLDATVFGVGTKVNHPGIADWKVDGEGLYDAGADVAATGVSFVESDSPDGLFNLVGSAGALISVTDVAPALGGVAYFLKTVQADVQFFGGHGDLIPFSISSSPSSYGCRGSVLLPNAQQTGAGNGSGLQLGALTSDQRLVVGLHVLQFNGTTMTMIVQSDNANGFGSPTTVATMTAATGLTSQWKEVAGPITDDWFRASWTFTGTSFTALVVVGIASLF